MARAETLCALGRFEEADIHFRLAVDRAQVVFGERSVELAYALNGLGMNCKYSERFDEAEPLYHRAIGIILAVTARNYARLLRDVGRGDQAAKVLSENKFPESLLQREAGDRGRIV
jgi:tetratricopeptide (TPR) repeat protein